MLNNTCVISAHPMKQRAKDSFHRQMSKEAKAFDKIQSTNSVLKPVRENFALLLLSNLFQ